jgi:hypothetical protein
MEGHVVKSVSGTTDPRWIIAAGLMLASTALTFLIVRSGSPSELRERPVALTTLGAPVLGPFTGAVARNGQSCCLDASRRIAAVCGPILAVGVLSQFAIGGSSGARRILRLVPWTIGWLAWLGGGFVSFFHAFA